MRWSLKKNVLFLIAFVTILLIGWYSTHPLGTKLTIRDHTFNVELAVTPKEKERGLGYRDSLKPDSGMLFVYDHAEQYGFWMKGMRFPLDFIWINGLVVADLTPNVAPPTNGMPLISLQPKFPVDKVLEVNAGTIERFGIEIGDLVKITQ